MATTKSLQEVGDEGDKSEKEEQEREEGGVPPLVDQRLFVRDITGEVWPVI